MANEKSERGQARGPKMYNPDTEEVRQVRGPDVAATKEEGFLVVGNRPPDEYLGKTREELLEEFEDPRRLGVEEGPATNTAGFEVDAEVEPVEYEDGEEE